MPRTPKTAKKSMFTLCQIGYEGANPEAAFVFHADNDNDAENKALNWCLYHGRKYGRDAVVRPAQGVELNWDTHNEWVK